jgi:hypothetical protein
MPVANCIVSPDKRSGAGDLIKLWSRESGISSENMTINIIVADRQFGRSYSVMADLLLPSMWSGQSISALQTGLTRALAHYFLLDLQEVLVATRIIPSGRVVENGEEVTW